MRNPESPRNSPLRKFSEKLLDPIINRLVKIPGIEANHITLAGLGLVVAGSLERWINKSEVSPYIAIAFLTLGVSCDALDGLLARKLNQSSEKGALLDLMTDRIQESAMALTRVAMATERGDLLGIIAAFVNGLTNPFPSLLRANAESKGLVVSESGKNPLSFLGTRGGRAITNIWTTTFPKSFTVEGQSSQALVDGLSALANIISSLERLSLLIKKPGTTISDEKVIDLGRKKTERLIPYVLINSLVMIGGGVIGLLNNLQR